MKISYNWIQTYFDKKLPEPEKLAELLTMHSQEVDSVEPKNARPLTPERSDGGQGDFELEVKILPNRAYDYINYLGVIRDISAILKLEAKISLPEPKEREIIFVKESDFEKILGVKIPEKEISEILKRLGMEVSKKESFFAIGAPSERPDLKIKEGIMGEVARIYGYDKIEEKIPEGLLVPPKRNDTLFFSSIARKIMVGLGFSEVYNYSFSKNGDWELQNPPSQDNKFLRTNLAEGLSANTKENSKYFKDIKIFEIGKIFPKDGEVLSIAAISAKADFYEMKGAVDALLEGLGIDDFYYEDHDNKVAEVHIDGKAIGHIDHNSFEFDFDELAKLADESAEYEPISKYPAIVRDIAVLVPLNEKVENVLDIIENTAGKLLVDTDLFDIYENDDRKSLAFHLIFQSSEKTLTDEEVNAIMEKIFTAIEANDDWEVRR